LVRDLNALYARHDALFDLDADERGFQWLDVMDRESSIVVFRRLAQNGSSEVIVAGNFTPVVRSDYRIPLPHSGEYRLILNTDDVPYGGRGVPVSPSVRAEPVQWHGQPCSAAVTLPPLAMVMFEGSDPASPNAMHPLP
jgi:1,4-alpha-glucan branching enzyme